MDENRMEKEQEGISSASEDVSATVDPSPKEEQTTQEKMQPPIGEPASPETPIPLESAQETTSKNPAPKSKLPWVLGGIIVVLIIAIVACFGLGVFSNPEKAMTQAFEATAQAQEEFQQQLLEELPAYRLLYGGSEGARKADFQFALDSIEIPGISAEEMALYNQILKGTGMRGAFVSDPENGVYELDGTLQLAGADLMSLYGYLSPEQMAFSIPDFSETALSINLQTLAEDLTTSPLTGGMSAEEAQATQEAIQGFQKLLDALMNLDYAQMEEDLKPILEGLRANATYEDLGDENGLKVYAMDIPGSNVKQFISDICQYIYVDSSIGQALEQLYNSTAPSVGYQDWIQQDILSVLQSDEMPELPLRVVAKVGSGNLIRAMDISLVISDEMAAQGLEVAAFSYTEDENHNVEGNFQLKATDPETGEVVDLSVPVTATYQDGLYQVTVSLNMPAVDGVEVSLMETLALGQDGTYRLTMEEAFQNTALQENMAYNISLDGTVTEDGDTVTYDFPTIQMDIDAMGDVISLAGSASATSTPVEAPYTISRPTVDLFSMSQEELAAELQKYTDGVNGLATRLMGIVMGGAMMPTMEAVPEPAA